MEPPNTSAAAATGIRYVRQRILANEAMAAAAASADEQPQDRQLDMEVGVAGADHDAVIVVEQQIAVEHVGPRLQREEETEQRRAVGDAAGETPAAAVEIDLAVHAIDRAGDERRSASSISSIQFLSAT